MKSTILLTSIFAFLIIACDSNEPARQKVTAPIQEAEKAPVVAETIKPEIKTPPAIENTSLQTAEQVTPTQPLSGEAIYKKTCFTCHTSGAANAPKLGDRAAWKPRIEKGFNALLQSAINGIPGTSMLKRGTCMSCSDDDLKAAIEYMVSQSQ
ncbi:MAG: c-type cytochrome [Gammaproteobacteria bacterium]|nr:c-type cytochrome [Gammaproteobacteria bacterium]